MKTTLGKILILANECYPQVCVGGLGKFVAGIRRGLVENNWQVKVFGPRKKTSVYLPCWSSQFPSEARKAALDSFQWSLVNRWRPDLIWVQDFEGAYQAEEWKKITANWRRKPRILWTIHSPLKLSASYGYGYSQEPAGDPINWGDDFFDFSGLIEKGVCNADLITTVSSCYARDLNRLEFFQKNKVIGINNGIDLADWNPIKDKLIGYGLGNNWVLFKKINKIVLQKLFCLPEKEIPVFAFVSRLVPQKGVDLLLKILPQFLSKNDTQFFIVGQGLAKYHRLLLALKKQFPLQLGLCLKSDFSLPHQVFAGADFLLLPSLAEPFGIVVSEARSYGAIPVVRKVDGLAEQVNDEINGLSFSGNRPEFIIEKLNAALRLRKTNQWYGYSYSGKKLVSDWGAVAKKYEPYLLATNKKRHSAARRSEEEVFSS